MKTIDGAIKHCEDVAESCACLDKECSEEHKQLAKWLLELREYKELEPAISMLKAKNEVVRKKRKIKPSTDIRNMRLGTVSGKLEKE